LIFFIRRVPKAFTSLARSYCIFSLRRVSKALTSLAVAERPLSERSEDMSARTAELAEGFPALAVVKSTPLPPSGPRLYGVGSCGSNDYSGASGDARCDVRFVRSVCYVCCIFVRYVRYVRDVRSARLERFARRFVDETIADVDESIFEPRGRVGDVTREVLAEAAETDPRFLVIGGRRRSPTRKAIFGSSAQEILPDADCPVL
jgi:hypothetical protein